MKRDLRLLQKSDFDPFIGREFLFKEPASGLTHSLTLFECAYSKYQRNPRKGRREAFSLLFRSEAPANLVQGIYDISEREFGEAAVFATPVIIEEEGFFVEAVFN